MAKARGSLARKRTVIEYKKDPDRWKKDNNYEQRWQAEPVFSSINYNSMKKLLNKGADVLYFSFLNPAINGRFIVSRCAKFIH